MRPKILSLILLNLALIYPAHATYYGTSSRYYVLAHFSDVAYGKEVKAVYVHAGVLERRSDFRPHVNTTSYYWESVIDFQEMERLESGFFTKFTLMGQSGGGAGGASYTDLGPRIQYWVYFKDGSSMITEDYAIPVQNGAGTEDQVKIELREFEAANAGRSTEAYGVNRSNALNDYWAERQLCESLFL